MRLSMLLLAAAATLAACGANAPPNPTQGAKTGVSVSGDARIGVTATL
ncbi:hypothetical protein [Oceaniglobus roseus]|nr:hypothetical protein [Kandeliimicrobium roseum]